MQTLRNAHFLARLVLVWFVLFVGVSVASPLVNPDGVQLVCSTAGSVKLVSSDAGAQSGLDDSERGHGMHCPLCLPLAMPPAVTIGSMWASHLRLTRLSGPAWPRWSDCLGRPGHPPIFPEQGCWLNFLRDSFV